MQERRALGASRRYAIDLVAIVDAAIVVAPRAALRGPEEACPGDVTIDADLGASDAVDVLLSHVSASAIEAVCLRMIDSLDRETLMEIGPGRRFVGVDDRALGNTGADEELSVLKTAGTEFAARSRITTTTGAYPVGSGQTAAAMVYFRWLHRLAASKPIIECPSA